MLLTALHPKTRPWAFHSGLTLGAYLDAKVITPGPLFACLAPLR